MALDTQFTFSGVSRTSVLPDKTCVKDKQLSVMRCMFVCTPAWLSTPSSHSPASLERSFCRTTPVKDKGLSVMSCVFVCTLAALVCASVSCQRTPGSQAAVGGAMCVCLYIVALLCASVSVLKRDVVAVNDALCICLYTGSISLCFWQIWDLVSYAQTAPETHQKPLWYLLM